MMGFNVKFRLPGSPIPGKYSWAKHAVPGWLASQKKRFQQAVQSTDESPALASHSVDMLLRSIEDVVRRRKDCVLKEAPDELYRCLVRDLQDVLAQTTGLPQCATISPSPSYKSSDGIKADDRHASFGSSGPDSLESIDLWTLLRRLADLVHFCTHFWTRFEHDGALDFQIGCVITNLAIREMQRLHLEFIYQYPGLATAEEVHQYLGVKIHLAGQQWQMTLPRYLQSSKPSEHPLRDILYPASYAYLSFGIATIGKEVIGGGNPSLIGDLDPVSDAASIAFFTLAKVLKSGQRLPRQDCLLDGMIDAYESGTVPTWLPYAFAAYEPVFGMIADQAPRSWHLQQVFFFQASKTILQSPSSPTSPDRGQLQATLTSRSDDMMAFHRLTRVLDCSEKLLRYGMNNEPLEACLKRFPIAACAFGFQSRIDMYLGGLACCNTRYILCLAAHLYQACVSFKLLPQSWKDLEYVLGVHSESTSGLPPTATAEGCFNVHDKFKAAFGPPTSGRSQRLRLRPQLPLAYFISTSQVQSEADFWNVCEAEVLKYIPLTAGDGGGPNPYNRGLDRLLESLEQHKFEMSFDYVQMAWNCEQFLRSVRKTCQIEQNEGKSYLNLVHEIIAQSQELFRETRSHALGRNTMLWKTSTVLKSFISKAGGEIYHKAHNSLVAGSSIRMISIKAKSHRESLQEAKNQRSRGSEESTNTVVAKDSSITDTRMSVDKAVKTLNDWMESDKRWESVLGDDHGNHGLGIMGRFEVEEICAGLG